MLRTERYFYIKLWLFAFVILLGRTVICLSGHIVQLKKKRDESFGQAVSSGQPEDREDDQILQELCFCVSNMYQSIVQVTALHYTGMSVDQSSLHQKVIMAIGNEGLRFFKLLGRYASKIIRDPKVSIGRKVRDCALMGGALLLTFWYIKRHVSVSSSSTSSMQTASSNLSFQETTTHSFRPRGIDDMINKNDDNPIIK